MRVATCRGLSWKRRCDGAWEVHGLMWGLGDILPIGSVMPARSAGGLRWHISAIAL